jgi:branched-subunit amino acid permease
MLFFASLFALGVYWRRKPEFHRRLLFLATCVLLDAAFGRFLYIFHHSLFYLCLDAVMLLGVARDLVVNRSVHKVYRIAIPLLCAAQPVVVYLWRASPAWWLGTTKAILGL